MSVVKREDWFLAALPILKTKGIDGVTIESLCESVNRTKGSFYHHFKDQAVFTQALLDWWFDISTNNVINIVDLESSPAEKMEKLEEISSTMDLQIEVAFRGWAHFEERAAKIMKKVDDTRNRFLADIYKEFIKDEELAESLAAIDYAAFLGFLLMDFNLFKSESMTYRKYSSLYNEAMLLLVKRKEQFRKNVDISEMKKLFMT